VVEVRELGDMWNVQIIAAVPTLRTRRPAFTEIVTRTPERMVEAH
jgi:hypothetical protein